MMRTPERLQDWPVRQAQVRPEAVAVVGSDGVLSYGELDALSNRIAGVLTQAGCRRGDRVCLMLEKSPLAVAALLGIYKADCIYVPLDPGGPPERQARIVLNSQASCLLAGSAARRKLPAMLRHAGLAGRLGIGWLDQRPPGEGLPAPCFTLADVEAASPAPGLSRNRASDPAHILFTSGSTGEPKGVVISHGNVAPFIRWGVEYFGIDGNDRLSGHPPLNFDLSIFDLFATFAAGAQLHLVPAGLNLMPHKLVQWIRQSELTQWFSVPSLLTYLAKFDVVRQGDFPALRRLLWCGEVFPTPALRYWMERLPHVSFTNLYGPTETTIASSYYAVPAPPEDDRPVPIGRPCPGEELVVLNASLRETAAKEEGELYIGGCGLSQGYWNDEDKTNAVFVPDPRGGDGRERLYKTGDRALRDEDGLVHYLGRLDEQVKSRGYRIELGEIETALSACPWLKEAVVVTLPSDGFENTRICCAFAAADGDSLPVDVRRYLAEHLPSYMVPSEWAVVPDLPRNDNGKIDRRRVKEMFLNQMDGTETERRLQAASRDESGNRQGELYARASSGGKENHGYFY